MLNDEIEKKNLRNFLKLKKNNNQKNENQFVTSEILDPDPLKKLNSQPI
jgi:hypothetical protein